MREKCSIIINVDLSGTSFCDCLINDPEEQTNVLRLNVEVNYSLAMIYTNLFVTCAVP